MDNSLFHFKVGELNCMAIRDGDDGNQNVVLVDTGSHKLVIDPGNGPATSPPGLLLERLQAAGIRAEDIDLVILSHADFDHVGGTVTADGKPAFPNARYVLSQKELEFWDSKPVRLKPAPEYSERFLYLENEVPPNSLAAIRDRLETVTFGAEIVPGIRTREASGHTPGHMAIEISSGGEQVTYIGDLLYQPENIEDPEWYSVYDNDPAQAVATRKRVFTQAARDQQVLLAYHMVFPGLGTVTQQERGWKWKPYQPA